MPNDIGVESGPTLTGRESQIASLASKGMTNSRIAAVLHLTVSTVEQHLTRVYRKLACHRDGLAAALQSAPNTQEHTR